MLLYFPGREEIEWRVYYPVSHRILEISVDCL